MQSIALLDRGRSAPLADQEPGDAMVGAIVGRYRTAQVDPNQPVVLVNRSIAAARLGRRSEAANDQRQALALDPAILDDRR